LGQRQRIEVSGGMSISPEGMRLLRRFVLVIEKPELCRRLSLALVPDEFVKTSHNNPCLASMKVMVVVA
jgi:hypothetical protein